MKNVVKLGEHYFKYDQAHGIVSMMFKPSASELKMMEADNAEWSAKFGRNLWEIDENGLCEIDSAGLSRENWNDPESRRSYLLDWADDMAEESAVLAAEFVKYELPYINTSETR